MKESTANVLTSTAYLLPGAVAYIYGDLYTSIGFTILAYGSAIFHHFEPKILEDESVGRDSSEYKWAQRFDEVGMYLAFVPLFWRTIPDIGNNDLLLVIVSLIFAASYKIVDSHKALPTIIGLGLIGTWIFHSSSFAILSLVYFLAAIALRPHNHSAWHIASAIAASFWIIGVMAI